jgi:hypothetical protein
LQMTAKWGHPSWPYIHRRWTGTYPDKKWTYKSYRGLRQAFMRLMHPKYRRPKWKGRDTS